MDSGMETFMCVILHFMITFRSIFLGAVSVKFGNSILEPVCHERKACCIISGEVIAISNFFQTFIFCEQKEIQKMITK